MLCGPLRISASSALNYLFNAEDAEIRREKANQGTSGSTGEGWLLFCAAAVDANSDNPQQVLGDFKPVFGSHCVLDGLEFG